MNILIKFPTRGRPERFINVLDNYINLAANKEKLYFIVSVDQDDPTVTPEFLDTTISKHPNLIVYVGKSNNKVHAINRDMDKAPVFDILLLASDDMVPIVWGYDLTIQNAMKKYYPDTDGVLWFNDGLQGNGLNTLPIMGRKYYQRFGYIYNPIYKTAWCDNEFTEISKILGRQTYFPEVIIEHRHFINGKAPIDSTYIKNDNGADEDTEIYKSRRKMNYGFGGSNGLAISLPTVKIRVYK